MFYQPQRSPDQAFDFGSLSDKIPQDMGGIKPTIPLNPKDTGADLTPEQKLAAAELEIERRRQEANRGTQPPTTPPATPPADEPTETNEQIQATLTALEARDESTYTDEEKAYIAKYTTPELTPVDTARNYMIEKYSLDLAAKKYDNSPEGLANIVDDVAPMVAEQILEDHFATIPYMQEFYEHVSQGRGLETFLANYQTPVYDTIDIREPNADADDPIMKQAKNNQRAMIRLELQQRGMDGEEIESLIDLTESANKLGERAIRARLNLKAAHEANVSAMLQQEEQEIQEQEQEKQERAIEALQMFEKNDFGGLSIPVSDLNMFKEAEFRTDSQGKTLLDYKREQLTLAQRLFIDYLILKDFKGVGTPKTPQQSKQFIFQKANEANNVRNGGRLRGADQIQHAQINPQDLNNLNLKIKT